MTRTFKPMDAAEQAAFVERLCLRCPRQVGCTILADARPLDAFDADYPPELIYDDDAKPFCTSFAYAAIDAAGIDLSALPAVTARPVPPLPAATAAPAAARRGGAKRPKPVTIRADRPVRSVTIVTRTGKDGTNLSSTIRLQLAGDAR